MAKRIRREIVIGGRKQWITAYTEQEYANKLMAIVGTAEERNAMHPFKDFAQEWYLIFFQAAY